MPKRRKGKVNEGYAGRDRSRSRDRDRRDGKDQSPVRCGAARDAGRVGARRLFPDVRDRGALRQRVRGTLFYRSMGRVFVRSERRRRLYRHTERRPLRAGARRPAGGQARSVRETLDHRYRPFRPSRIRGALARTGSDGGDADPARPGFPPDPQNGRRAREDPARRVHLLPVLLALRQLQTGVDPERFRPRSLERSRDGHRRLPGRAERRTFRDAEPDRGVVRLSPERI